MRYPTLRVCCFALNLLPFAGIAFLWFVGVLRDRMGAPRRPLLRHGVPRQRAPLSRDDLGLFGGCRWSHDGVRSDSGEDDGLGVYRFARTVAYELVNVYAIRIAGVFMISTYTLAIRVGMFPRWMALLGYALVLLLLLSPGRFNWAPLVFPLSAFVISVYVLLANLRPKAA